jgi:hypothetical protein
VPVWALPSAEANKADLKTYLDSGGRAFLEHYHDTWLRGGNEDISLETEFMYQVIVK